MSGGDGMWMAWRWQSTDTAAMARAVRAMGRRERHVGTSPREDRRGKAARGAAETSGEDVPGDGASAGAMPTAVTRRASVLSAPQTSVVFGERQVGSAMVADPSEECVGVHQITHCFRAALAPQDQAELKQCFRAIVPTRSAGRELERAFAVQDGELCRTHGAVQRTEQSDRHEDQVGAAQLVGEPLAATEIAQGLARPARIEVLLAEVAARERLTREVIHAVEELDGFDEAPDRPIGTPLRSVDLPEQAQRVRLADLVPQAVGEIAGTGRVPARRTKLAVVEEDAAHDAVPQRRGRFVAVQFGGLGPRL